MVSPGPNPRRGQSVQLVLALPVASAVARGRAAGAQFAAGAAYGAVLCARTGGGRGGDLFDLMGRASEDRMAVMGVVDGAVSCLCDFGIANASF